MCSLSWSCCTLIQSLSESPMSSVRLKIPSLSELCLSFSQEIFVFPVLDEATQLTNAWKLTNKYLGLKKIKLLLFFCQIEILDKDSSWLRVCVKWFKVPSALETVMGCDRSADTTRRRQLSLARAIVFQLLGALPASGRKVDQLGVANQAAAISGPFFLRFLRSKFKSQNYYSPNA